MNLKNAKVMNGKICKFIKSVKKGTLSTELYEELKDTEVVKTLDSVMKCYSLFYWTESNLLNAECEGVEIPHNAWGDIVDTVTEANKAIAMALRTKPSRVDTIYTSYPNIYDNCRDGYGRVNDGVFVDYNFTDYDIENFEKSLNELVEELYKIGYYERIEELIGSKAIQLRNTKVKFIVKLLKCNLNTVIYRYIENWYIRLMDWYNDGYLYSNRDVAEELYDDWTKFKPYVDMNKIPNEIMEALVDLLEKMTLEQ